MMKGDMQITNGVFIISIPHGRIPESILQNRVISENNIGSLLKIKINKIRFVFLLNEIFKH